MTVLPIYDANVFQDVNQAAENFKDSFKTKPNTHETKQTLLGAIEAVFTKVTAELDITNKKSPTYATLFQIKIELRAVNAIVKEVTNMSTFQAKRVVIKDTLSSIERLLGKFRSQLSEPTTSKSGVDPERCSLIANQ